MTDRPNFNNRASHMSKFLIGTKPINHRVFEIVHQYEELVKQNHVTSGPIAQQYHIYKKLQSEMKRKLKGGMKKILFVNKLSGGSAKEKREMIEKEREAKAEREREKEEEKRKLISENKHRHRGAIQLGDTLSKATEETKQAKDDVKILNGDQ